MPGTGKAAQRYAAPCSDRVPHGVPTTGLEHGIDLAEHVADGSMAFVLVGQVLLTSAACLHP